MNTHRINVFHITYSNAVPFAVPHHLILNLFPACNAALHKYLSHTGKTQTILQNLYKLVRIVGNTAAAATQGVSRAQYYRIADFISKRKTVIYIFYYKRSRHRLADLLHCRLEFQTVFCLPDCLRSCSDQTHTVFPKETGLFQLHRQIQPGLSSKCGKDTVRSFFLNKLFHNLYSQRFNIYAVRNIFICHDRRRIGV